MREGDLFGRHFCPIYCKFSSTSSSSLFLHRLWPDGGEIRQPEQRSLAVAPADYHS
jgi:hypothetical protein